eukprot:jgi/Hompol1/3539/HPOL_006597-RA
MNTALRQLSAQPLAQAQSQTLLPQQAHTGTLGLDGIEGTKMTLRDVPHSPRSPADTRRTPKEASHERVASSGSPLTATNTNNSNNNNNQEKSSRSDHPKPTRSGSSHAFLVDGRSSSRTAMPSLSTLATDTAQQQEETVPKVAPPDDPSDEIQASANLAAAKGNPKFHRMIQHIEAITERTQNARTELETMIALTRELKEQCLLQEKECASLEEDRLKIKAEITGLNSRLAALSAEKHQTEAKLDELRSENAKLEAFLL